MNDRYLRDISSTPSTDVDNAVETGTATAVGTGTATAVETGTAKVILLPTAKAKPGGDMRPEHRVSKKPDAPPSLAEAGIVALLAGVGLPALDSLAAGK